ncbi:MAG: phage tail sheath family protein [Ramlibacter sp.]
MVLNLATPGVYVQELPGSPGITGVSTSVAAFVGVTASGPVQTPTRVSSWNEYQQHFGGLAWNAMVSWAVYGFFAEGGGPCHVVQAADLAKATAARLCTGPLTLSAATPGAWGNALHVRVSNTPLPAGSGANPTTPLFDLSVLLDPALLAPPGGPVARLLAFVQANTLASVEIDGKRWVVLEQFSRFTAGSLLNGELASRVNGQSIFVRVAVAPLTEPQRPANTGALALAGGSEPRLDLASALTALDSVPDISLLALPDTVSATGPDGEVSVAVQATQIQTGLQYCETRTSLFMVADPPAELDVPGVLSFKTGAGTAPGGNPQALNSAYGALYYPWVFVFHAPSATQVPMPPSGPVLGRYVYTDQSAGVFKAPAGVTDGALPSVTQLATQLTDSEQGQLNPQGINGLRNLINYGNVIWGARTLSVDLQWTYVSVRRLVIYVEQSLRQGLQWVTFAPDANPTWAAVTAQVSQFLTGLWQAGGLFGATAAEAFFVTCDASNNPPEAQMQGVLYVTVGLAVTHPAEFIVLQVSQPVAQAGS